ncbi:phosphoribosylanthranilate isomerase [Sporosarcina sp. ACRSL]|uniref:phosphoribosylanthranilate isomerase n=1 Tax=Sporosarcina sp. ACRSL TaxID=2918215 RepID=UPI001EF4AF97|nr:phosphoribosylanthranilate isomerase [Sporosarcina sp. ACRSL]MCG7343649.1 phosphoribosylanthranilate isomerase [Sporosarcina sp. ACRSL]
MSSNEKFSVFLQIAKELNAINIIPLLMGSVGLEIVTKRNWDASDLDIHVPGDSRGWEAPAETALHNWQDIMSIMEQLGYELIDLHEHEFRKNDISVEFGIVDTLPDFAGIQLNELEVHSTEGIEYYLLSAEQYLAVYEASSKDSYRAENNNFKDLEKIKYLKGICGALQ